MRSEKPSDEDARGGEALAFPPVPMVGHLTMYPTPSSKGEPGEHRCIVIAISTDELYLAPICTYDNPNAQDPACVVERDEIPGGKLTKPKSFVEYRHIAPLKASQYQAMLDAGTARYLTHLPPVVLVRALEGLNKTKYMTPPIRAKLFGPSRQERLAGLLSSSNVKVESRYPGRLRRTPFERPNARTPLDDNGDGAATGSAEPQLPSTNGAVVRNTKRS